MADSIVVIQCAGGKQPNAGHLRNNDGRKLMFIAHPNLAPENDDYVYARPDDRADTGLSWRKELLRYNQEQAADNPLGLLPAWQLYKPRNDKLIYEQIYRRYGPDNLYILSAGWGLLRADFLTPAYDITFSNAQNVDKYKRRGKQDSYDDLRMLPSDTTQPVVFFGGKDYVNLFCQLTTGTKGARYVFYNSRMAPDAPNCQTIKFDTRRKTNWQYEAAQAFANGHIGI